METKQKTIPRVRLTYKLEFPTGAIQYFHADKRFDTFAEYTKSTKWYRFLTITESFTSKEKYKYTIHFKYNEHKSVVAMIRYSTKKLAKDTILKSLFKLTKFKEQPINKSTINKYKKEIGAHLDGVEEVKNTVLFTNSLNTTLYVKVFAQNKAYIKLRFSNHRIESEEAPTTWNKKKNKPFTPADFNYSLDSNDWMKDKDKWIVALQNKFKIKEELKQKKEV